ncbi:mapk-regulated corepressor-interacting protein 1 isoform X3 [Oncorhynchus kisutch]|uniref:mapk-regulated corepressor-interacting protein 1 isoform X3 n=1 Tax=Oncorhynchus kisutch TaxID=8019 RepID=UPI0012DC20A0|nr:mapk-regulated corepressor-interacting protein 1 isoform X3 [Oncorhynchus kisutch]
MRDSFAVLILRVGPTAEPAARWKDYPTEDKEVSYSLNPPLPLPPNYSLERSKRQTAHRMSSSAPRMVNNYKRTSSPRSPTNSGELFTPAHEENVRFIHDTWQCVLRDIRSPQSSERKDRGPQEYVEKNPNPNLNSFTPVDLSDLKKRNTQDSKKS